MMRQHSLAGSLMDTAAHAVVWQSVGRVLRSMSLIEMLAIAAVFTFFYLALRRPY
jgi:hypothetical protein